MAQAEKLHRMAGASEPKQAWYIWKLVLKSSKFSRVAVRPWYLTLAGGMGALGAGLLRLEKVDFKASMKEGQEGGGGSVGCCKKG